MKVLLINSPVRLNAKPNNIPYGLATVASTLRENGFEVEIYDINALRPGNDNIIDTLQSKYWDVVGLSGLITTYGFQKWLIRQLRDIHPEGFIVSGGGLATSNSDMLFQHTDVDVSIIGEGEQTMLALCQTLESGGHVEDVTGIWFRKNGHVTANAGRPHIVDLNTIPFPAWGLLPMETYLQNPVWGDAASNSSGFRADITMSRSMNIISSRGCPFTCKYCYHLFGRSNYRFRSAQNVIDEIKLLVERYGVDFIGFVDDNMMASKGRLLEFCNLMVKKRLPITWGCHGRVTSAKPAVLRHMANAGCVWIGYGIESGSQKILDAMNKRVTVEQAKDAIINTRKAGIFANTTFIFGYPGETRETIQETIDLKRELGIECGSFFATPYPGTPLYEEIKGRIVDEEAFVQSLGNATDFSINLMDFPNEELFRLKEAMDNNEDVM
jgi:radical SAM superfamily enzyme YgiQ (UPF0313 family)